MTADMPSTHANEESYIERGVIVPVDLEGTHDEEHSEHGNGEREDPYELDRPTGDTVVATDLDPFYMETETRGVEAVTM